MSQDTHILIWNRCLRMIEQIVNQKAFETWFKPIRPESFEEGVLTVNVPSEFFREYLEEYYLDVLKKTLKKEIGADARLVYRVAPVKVQPPMEYPAAHCNTPENKPISVPNFKRAGSPNPFVIPGLQQVKVNTQLNPNYCFGNLVEGECNKMGITAGESIAMHPGKTAFNPLFLFVPANRFKTQYMDAVTVKNNLTDFLSFYMRMDVLIIDDIQDLSSPGAQNGFFQIFNHLHQSGKQLIFTSDRPPVELQNFEERLLSRLKWGLSVELQRPDFATRLSMLKSRSFREGVKLRDDVLHFLASRITSNFRELEGALISLIANATFAHREITVELAERITGKIVSEQKNDITIEKVQKTVCQYFNISMDSLLSKSRKRQIVQARQIAMYMSRNLLKCSLSTIGSEIGGKDHSTVLHACATVQDLMSIDKTFRQYVTDIEKMLVPARG